MEDTLTIIAQTADLLQDSTIMPRMQALLAGIPVGDKERVTLLLSQHLPPPMGMPQEKFTFTLAAPGTWQDTYSFIRDLHFPDRIVYPMHVSMPYSKSDMEFFQKTDRLGLPVLVIPLGWESIREENREKVFTYLQLKLKVHASVTLLETMAPEDAPAVFHRIELALEKDPARSMAGTYRNVCLETVALQLQECCAARIKEIGQNRDHLETRKKELEEMLAGMKLSWLSLAQHIEKYRYETEHKLVDALEHDAEGFLREMRHSLQNTGNPKNWWEKELPYQLESFFRSRTSQIETVINKDIIATVNMMKAEIEHIVHQKSTAEGLELTFSFDGYASAPDDTDFKIKDSRPLDIGIRIASVGSMGLTMALLASIPVAGTYAIPIIFSQAVAIAGSQYKLFSSSKNKEKIEEMLPMKVDFCVRQISRQISGKIRGTYEQIVESLNAQQARWEEEQIKHLEAEEADASDKERLAQWKSCLNRLETITQHQSL